jgi:Putative coat protein
MYALYVGGDTMTKKLHPKVAEFKSFVKKHPKIIKDVRNGTAQWQDLFEDWYLLGEEDSRWDEYREDREEKKKTAQNSDGNKAGSWVDQIREMVKNMDANQLQGHINSISEALGAVQGVLSQFQSSNSTKATPKIEETSAKPSHPFSFRKD